MKIVTLLGLTVATAFVAVQVLLPAGAMILWNSLIAPMGAPEMGICEALCFSIVTQIVMGRLGIFGLGR